MLEAVDDSEDLQPLNGQFSEFDEYKGTRSKGLKDFEVSTEWHAYFQDRPCLCLTPFLVVVSIITIVAGCFVIVNCSIIAAGIVQQNLLQFTLPSTLSPIETDNSGAASSGSTSPGELTVAEMLSRFAPYDLKYDMMKDDAQMLALVRALVKVATIAEQLFFRQVWSNNEALLSKLMENEDANREVLTYFNVNFGPWSIIDEDDVFVKPPKGLSIPAQPPAGANYYPEDISILEWSEALASATTEVQHRLKSYYYAIRRSVQDQHLIAVPYSVEYEDLLSSLRESVIEALSWANLVGDSALVSYLNALTASSRSNDWNEAARAWLKLDSSIEFLFGPFEVYTDRFQGLKASFESLVAMRRPTETQRLQAAASLLQFWENSLPEPAAWKNPAVVSDVPVVVVDELYAGGSLRQGVNTAAFNLPNDGDLVQEIGSKRVMLYNVEEAKFTLVLLPIAEVVLADTTRVSFQSFFDHVAFHELCHGIGVKNNIHGFPVHESLGTLYSPIEEAKADICGLWAMDLSQVTFGYDMASVYDTYLASSFRSMRFGLKEAHALGQAVQLNYLWKETGAIAWNGATGTFHVVSTTDFAAGVQQLLEALLALEGNGDKAAAADFLGRHGTLTPQVTEVLQKIGERGIPVDIRTRSLLAQTIQR